MAHVRFTRPPVQSPPVALDDSAPSGALEAAPAWNQIGRVGTWKGHRAGAFELTVDDLHQIVRNFRAHRWYHAGPDGVGDQDVVPFDFHHASEESPSVIAIAGAPAQAWAQELEVRTENAANVPGIYARTRYIPPMDAYAKEGRYKSTSMVIWPNAIDPETGLEIGWYLSSIAFTNDPFIQGMESLAASREAARAGASLSFGLDPYAMPSTPEELVCALRELLELEQMAELSSVFAELSKLRAFALRPETAPPGVDVNGLVGGLRRLLNLPTLSDAATVFAGADELLARLAASPQPLPAGQPVSATSTKEPSQMILLTTLKGRFSLAAASTEEAVLDLTVKKLEAGASAETKISALLAALGVEDTGAGMAKITQMIQQAAALEEAMPELAELRKAKATGDAAAEEQEIDEVMATRSFPDAVRASLLRHRQLDLQSFRAVYPPLSNEQRAVLKRLTGPAAGGGTKLGTERGAQDADVSDESKRVLAAVQLMPGTDLVTQCRAYQMAEAKKLGVELSFDDAHRKGVALFRTFRKPLASLTGSVGT